MNAQEERPSSDVRGLTGQADRLAGKAAISADSHGRGAEILEPLSDQGQTRASQQ